MTSFVVLLGNEQTEALIHPWFVLRSWQKLVFPPSRASSLVWDVLKINTQCPEHLLPNPLKIFGKS